MQIINKNTNEDVTKKYNDMQIKEIIESGRKYFDSDGNEVKL
tara:strand:- start:486 stop:611 length:126 start_codon:yes stop_codon:yes gene_type:complete